MTEASLASQYEEQHTKEEILEQYLNTVYFGANAYWAEAAACTYFDKSATESTLPESALLAGIINLPVPTILFLTLGAPEPVATSFWNGCSSTGT